ncbi:MFS transporter [Longispora albida]|uniref:MFS transporter n=1 Tax=Longispora albida TaxID=203523 RepID=UPI00037E1D7E|nr:MFS transporter [Longispora albida]
MPVNTLRRSRAEAEAARLPAGFGLLWSGQAASELGTAVSGLALPLVAAVLLGGSPVQVGWLTAAAVLPWLVSLPVGVWVDRLPVKPILIGAELLRAAATCAIPLAWALDALSFPLLYTVAAVLGAGQVLFDTAWGSALPRMVGRAALVTAHSRLETTRSATSIGGPGLAGVLVRFAGAAPALLFDAATFLVSAFTVARGLPSLPADPGTRKEPVGAAIRAGIRMVFRQPALRALAMQAATWNMVSGASQTLFVLYALRVLGLDAGQIGLLFMVGGAGAVLGGLATPALLRRFAFGRIYILMVLAACAGMLLYAGSIPAVAAGQFLVGIGIAVTRVQAVALRQSLTPAGLLARTLVTYRLISLGTIPLGGVLGGLAGEAIGLREAVLGCGLLACLAVLPLVFSPIRGMRTLPATSEEGN